MIDMKWSKLYFSQRHNKVSILKYLSYATWKLETGFPYIKFVKEEFRMQEILLKLLIITLPQVSSCYPPKRC